MIVKSYNAKDCVITVDGVYITGLGEDMVSSEREEDLRTNSVGAQGDVVASETNNQLGTVTITVQVTSPQRSHLMRLAKRSEPFPLWVTNKKLGERFGGTMALMQNYPSVERGAEAGDEEYTFTVYDYTVDVE